MRAYLDVLFSKASILSKHYTNDASFEFRSVQQANTLYSIAEPNNDEKKKMYAHTAQSRSNFVI